MPPKRAVPTSPVVVINGPNHSDGNAEHHPKSARYAVSNKDAYLQTLANAWMKEVGGSQAGTTYTLAGLPQGYELYERPRPGNPRRLQIVQFSVYSSAMLRSPKPTNMDSSAMPRSQALVDNEGKRDLDSTNMDLSTIPQWQVPVDEEDTPDPDLADLDSSAIPQSPPLVGEEDKRDLHSALESLLDSEGHLKRRIAGRSSMDYFASTGSPNQSSFIPRTGEIVLYLEPLEDHLKLSQDFISRQVRVLDMFTNTSMIPQWLAGVITKVPPANSSFRDTQSLASNPNIAVDTQEPALNQRGYRISPVPALQDPNKQGKQRETCTPVHLIRPLSLHAEILAGIPTSNLHGSIANALTLSASVSLTYHSPFSPDWPDATVRAHGIFIGSEDYWVGDTAIILPGDLTAGEAASKILHIDDIIVRAHHLQPEPAGSDVTANDRKHGTIELQGHIYVLDPALCRSSPPIPVQDPTPSMRTYGTWYHQGQPGIRTSVRFTHVLARLYEYDTLKEWLPRLVEGVRKSSLLDIARDSVMRARAIAALHDERLVDEEGRKSWFWGENRNHALDLEDWLESGVVHDAERMAAGVGEKRVFDEGDGGSGDHGVEVTGDVQGGNGRNKRQRVELTADLPVMDVD
ncbi:MAG: hypothetical protein Q9170_003791 [Blastenia crenularia]